MRATLAVGAGVGVVALAASGSPGDRFGLPVSARGTGAYADGPPPAHTGGFGEPTCRECHLDSPERPAGVRLEVEGLPARYRPGRSYALKVVLEAPELRRGGFQLSARFLAGEGAGRPAGSLTAAGGRVEVVTAPGEGRSDSPGGAGADGRPEPVAYARQTLDGSLAPAGVAPGRLLWKLEWTAPSPGPGGGAPPVAVDVAANASNYDDSEFGDRIVVRRLVVPGPRRGGVRR